MFGYKKNISFFALFLAIFWQKTLKGAELLRRNILSYFSSSSVIRTWRRRLWKSEVNLLSNSCTQHLYYRLWSPPNRCYSLNEIIFITWCMVNSTGPPPPFAANSLALASSVDGSLLNTLALFLAPIFWYKNAMLLNYQYYFKVLQYFLKPVLILLILNTVP